MEFCEKRYSQKMIDEFTEKLKLAESLGGCRILQITYRHMEKD